MVQRTSHNITVPRSTILYERVHADVCGPFVPSIGESRYYVVFIEDSTRSGKVCMLKKRNDLYNRWVAYRTRRSSEGFSIQSLRFDNGGEFIGLRADLARHGINWERSPPYTQHANGIAERYIRALNTQARLFMLSSKVPDYFWADAIACANYVHLLIPQRNLNWFSPHELLKGAKHSNVHLRLFGCLAYRWLHPAQRQRGKWVSRASPSLLVGYGLSKTVYRLYDFTTKR